MIESCQVKKSCHQASVEPNQPTISINKFQSHYSDTFHSNKLRHSTTQTGPSQTLDRNQTSSSNLSIINHNHNCGRRLLRQINLSEPKLRNSNQHSEWMMMDMNYQENQSGFYNLLILNTKHIPRNKSQVVHPFISHLQNPKEC